MTIAILMFYFQNDGFIVPFTDAAMGTLILLYL
jgi:hypothetical protein